MMMVAIARHNQFPATMGRPFQLFFKSIIVTTLMLIITAAINVIVIATLISSLLENSETSRNGDNGA